MSQEYLTEGSQDTNILPVTSQELKQWLSELQLEAICTKFEQNNLKISELIEANELTLGEICDYMQLNPIQKLRMMNGIRKLSEKINKNKPKEIVPIILPLNSKEYTELIELTKSYKSLNEHVNNVQSSIELLEKHFSDINNNITMSFEELSSILAEHKKKLMNDFKNLKDNKQLSLMNYLNQLIKFRDQYLSYKKECDKVLYSQPGYDEDNLSDKLNKLGEILNKSAKFKEQINENYQNIVNNPINVEINFNFNKSCFEQTKWSEIKNDNVLIHLPVFEELKNVQKELENLKAKFKEVTQKCNQSTTLIQHLQLEKQRNEQKINDLQNFQLENQNLHLEKQRNEQKIGDLQKNSVSIKYTLSMSSMYQAPQNTYESLITLSTLTGAGTTSNVQQWIQATFDVKANVKGIILGAASSSMPGGWGAQYLNGVQCQYRNDNNQWINLFQVDGFAENEIKFFFCNVTTESIRLYRESSNYVALSVFICCK